jgi:hypothetical protein
MKRIAIPLRSIAVEHNSQLPAAALSQIILSIIPALSQSF